METEKKYKLTDEFITLGDKKLYRIEALKDFSNVEKGDKGGFVESEENLSQNGNCWVYQNAMVFENAEVFENAMVFENAEVFGNASIYGNAKVYENAEVRGDAMVCENAKVFGDAMVCENAKVFGDANIYGDAYIASNSDYIVFKNWWSSGRYFTWTRNNNMWKVGCFYGRGEELIAKAYRDSDLSGKEYERIVKYVESMLKDSNQ